MTNSIDFKKLVHPGAVAAVLLPFVVWGQPVPDTVSSAADVMHAGNFLGVNANYREMLNYNDCLDFKMRPCMWMCKTRLGLVPMPGIQFTYREPIAVTAIKCHQGSRALDDAAGILSGAMAQTTEKPDQACADNRQRENSMQQRSAYDATFYKVGWLARYRASGTPLQATQSLACGVLGSVGLFVNPVATSVVNNIPVQSGGANQPPPAPSVPIQPTPANQNASTSAYRTREGETVFMQNHQLHEQIVHNKQFGQTSQTSQTILAGPAPLPALEAFIPRVTQDRTGNLVAADGLQQTGTSQQAGMNGAVQAEAQIQLYSDVAGESKNLAKVAVESENADQLCTARTTLFETVKKAYSAVSASLVMTERGGFNAFPPGTYLGAEFQQEVDDNRPNPACPLTHAGYIVRPDLSSYNGYKRQYLNCHRVCKKDENGNRTKDCKDAPLPGYGGNCTTNILSQNVYAGMFPACNGLTPEWIANEDGDLEQVRVGYIQAQDHRRRLNGWIDQGIRDAAAGATFFALQSLDRVNDKILALGGQCDADGLPVGTWGRPLSPEQAHMKPDWRGPEHLIASQAYRVKTFGQSLGIGANTQAGPVGATASSNVPGFNLKTIIPTDLGSLLGMLPGGTAVSGIANTWSGLTTLSSFSNPTTAAMLQGPMTGLQGLNTLTGGLTSGISTVMTPLTSTLQGISGAVTGVAAPITNMVNTITAPITAFTSNMTSTISTMTAPITSALNTITSSISTSMNAVMAPITTAMNAVMGPINSAIGTVTGSMGQVFGTVLAPLTNTFNIVNGSLTVLNNSIGTATETMRSGGLAQAARGLVTCTMDQTGLCPAWKSEYATPQWFSPPVDVRSIVMPLINSVGGGICNGMQVFNDLGRLSAGSATTELNPLPAIQNQFCDGWGEKIPAVGYAYNREKTVAAANIFGKVNRIGESLWVITPDLSGQGHMFSYEYPQINRGAPLVSAAAPGIPGATRHKSSKCYNMGSSDPRWRTKGESLIPNLGNVVPTDAGSLAALATGQGNAHEGYHVFSTWKHTKCCIPLSCPWNVKRYY